MAFARSILVLLVIAAPAFADDKAEAKKHYELGKRHFNVSEFAEAIAEFKAAYKLHPQANDLYNIAQAYRLLGDCANAAQFYQNYQREEKIKKLRDSVDKVRVEMEVCAAAPKLVDPAASGPKPEPAATPVPPPQTYKPPPLPAGPPTGENAMRAPDPGDPNKARRVAGIVSMGIGGVFLIGTLYWAVEADARSKKVKDCELDDLCFEEDLKLLEKDRDVANKAAGGSFGGAVVFGVGGYLLYRFSKKPKPAQVTITPRSASIGWAF